MLTVGWRRGNHMQTTLLHLESPRTKLRAYLLELQFLNSETVKGRERKGKSEISHGQDGKHRRRQTPTLITFFPLHSSSLPAHTTALHPYSSFLFFGGFA
jgi:hypothetical protein